MKRKLFFVGLIGLLMTVGLILAGCGDNCGGGCKVTWTAAGEKLGGGACGAYSCSSKCIVYKNWSKNNLWPGIDLIIRCDCE